VGCFAALRPGKLDKVMTKIPQAMENPTKGDLSSSNTCWPKWSSAKNYSP
jgi:hypothetical protein